MGKASALVLLWAGSALFKKTCGKTHLVPQIKTRDLTNQEEKGHTEAGQLSAAPISAGRGWMPCPRVLPSSYTTPAVTSPHRKRAANGLESHTQTTYIQCPSQTTCSSSFPSND